MAVVARLNAVIARLDRLPILVALGLGALAVALTQRSLEGKSFLYGDLQHFFAFAEVLYTSEHFNYYANVSDQTFTYAHLPLFPMLLAPLQQVFDAQGWDRILAVKVIVHLFEVATAVLLMFLARRQELSRPLSLGVGVLWLFTPWVVEAGALNGHASAVAAFFLVAAVLRLGIPWQAGALIGLSVVTRSEFIVPALALAGFYLRRGRRPLGAYAVGAVLIAVLVVGPFLMRDAAAVHWAIVGHLQDRGDGLPIIRGIMRTFTGDMPDNLKGPQDWAFMVILAAAPLIGWASRDPRWGMLRASLLYAVALTLGHGRYYVLPLTSGLIVAARPGAILWLVPVYSVEFVLPFTRDLLWVVRTGGLMALGVLWWRPRPARPDMAADQPDSA